MSIFKEDCMKRIQGYLFGLVVVLALAGCSSHPHYGMSGAGQGDAYWQKGQQDMAALIDRTVKDQEKAGQVKSIVGEIVTELKASREKERAGHRRLYELSANYAATPEEFTKVLDDANNLRMQLAGSDLCEVIWKRWVTPWGQCLSRPHARVRSTFGIDIGLWPTATTPPSSDQPCRA
jgi:hypothetical protein